MNYATICSGIDAPAVAWQPLGWKQNFCSEIDRFPCAVLKHHNPGVPNLGDMTKYAKWPRTKLDVLIAGTPCQSFSIAGLRKGLADPRGNLTLTFLGLVEHFAPTWVVWENVPGVLSDDGGRTFGLFLGGMAQLGYGLAYGFLDAQYFGVPQRRRRPIVIGHIGGQWQRAAAVLFDRESLCGNPPPRRWSRERIAPTISSRAQGGGGLGTDFDLDGGVIPIQEIGKRQSGTPANGVGHGKAGDPMFTLQNSAVHGVGIPLVTTLDASNNFDRGDSQHLERLIPEIAYALQERDSNTKSGHLIPVASLINSEPISFPANLSGTQRVAADNLPSLKTVHPALAFTQNQAGDVLTGDICASIGTNQNATGRNTAKVQVQMAVRRLTPRECERLQGFPDDYTKIAYRGRAVEQCPDGPRYKALGNSMAVPKINWIGRRIEMVHKL